MPHPRLLHVLTFALCTVLTGGAALAQTAACARYRAELSAIESGTARQISPAAERLRFEIGRITNYYRSIGCEGGGPLSVFGVSAPPECASIAQRIRTMEANYARAVAEGDPSAVDPQERRQQLLAAIQQTCAQQEARPSTPGNFLERLFGGFRRQPDEREDTRPDVQEQDAGRSLGGRRLVCVRTCDGFFFPLSTVPGGRERADDMCHALCPGAEAQAFSMPEGDQALDRAVSLTGKPYTQLPTAFKYTKSFDASCSCKREGDTWAVALQHAEEMLDRQRGDIVVTAQKADELSRPKQAQPSTRERDRKAAAKPANDAADAVDTGANAPTASRESSGIGPQSIESSRVVGRTEGPTREVIDSSGNKRSIRIIGPNVTPAPEARQP
jgi:Protein of unknown function (DUF2865)